MRAPAWCKDAIPTLKGWACARTGELLKAQSIPAHVVDAYNKVEEVPVYEDVSEKVIASEEFKKIEINSNGEITEVEYVEYKTSAN